MKYSDLKPEQYFKFSNESKDFAKPLIWCCTHQVDVWPFNPSKSDKPRQIFSCRLAANKSSKRVPNPDEPVELTDPAQFEFLAPDLVKQSINKIIDQYNDDPYSSAESALSKIIEILESNGFR